MASTYSALKIQLMATGEDDGTWGDITNQNYLAFQDMITGTAQVAFNGANVQLVLADTNAIQPARALRLICTGTVAGATRDLIVPAGVFKQYLVGNSTDGSIRVRTSANAGAVTIPAGYNMILYNDGNSIFEANNYSAGLVVGAFNCLGNAAVGGTLSVGGAFSVGSIEATGSIHTVGNLVADAGIYTGPASKAAIVADASNTNIYTDRGVNSVLQYTAADRSFNFYSASTSVLRVDSGGSVSFSGSLYAGVSIIAGQALDHSFQVNVDPQYTNAFLDARAAPYSWLRYDKTNRNMQWIGQNNINFTSDDATGNFTVRGAITAPSLFFGATSVLNDNGTYSSLVFNTAGPSYLRYTKANGQLDYIVNNGLLATITPSGGLNLLGGVNSGPVIGSFPAGIYFGSTARAYLNSDNSTESQLVFDGPNGNYLRGNWNTGNFEFWCGNSPKVIVGNDGSVTANLFASGPNFSVNSSGPNTWLYLDKVGVTGFVLDKPNSFLHTYINNNAAYTFAPNIFYANQTIILRGSAASGTTTQNMVDGAVRWAYGSLANNGDFYWTAFNLSGGATGSPLRFGLADNSVTLGGVLRTSLGSGNWFAAPTAIMLTGSTPGISFNDSNLGTKGVLGQGGAGGVSTMYMALGNGTPSGMSFNITTGVSTGVAWNATSDERLKFDLAPLVGGLDALTDLNVFTYMQATNEEDAGQRIGTFGAGIIAQQLLGGPFDGLVVKPQPDNFGGETFYSFNYSGLMAWFIAAFKEVKARLVETEATLADLLARVAALEVR